MAVEQLMRPLVIMSRQMRQPTLHRSRIAKPFTLYVTNPAPQAGGDGQDQNGQREIHGAFGDQNAHQNQQAITRQEGGW